MHQKYLSQKYLFTPPHGDDCFPHFQNTLNAWCGLILKEKPNAMPMLLEQCMGCRCCPFVDIKAP